MGPYKSAQIAALSLLLQGTAVEEAISLLLRRSSTAAPRSKSGRNRKAIKKLSFIAAFLLRQPQLAATIAAPIKKTPQQKRFYIFTNYISLNNTI